MIRRFALAALLALTACVAASPLPARAQTFLESTTPPLETKAEFPPPPRQPSRNFVLGRDLNIVNGALVELRDAVKSPGGLGPLPSCAAGEYLTTYGTGLLCVTDLVGGGSGASGLPADPQACPAGQYVFDQSASGVLSCATPLFSALAGLPTTFAPSSHSHPVAQITATGTASSTTYLRGDGTWNAPPAGHTILDNGVAKPPRAGLRLSGNVSCTDNAGAGETQCLFPAYLLPAGGASTLGGVKGGRCPTGYVLVGFDVQTGDLTCEAIGTTLIAVATTDGNPPADPNQMMWLDRSSGGTPTAGAPYSTPAFGIYTTTQTVALASSTSGAAICYTIDGSVPAATTPGTCSSGLTYSTPITISSTTTVRALATKAAYATSPLTIGVFTINMAQVPTPTISPAAGTYAVAQSVTFSPSMPPWNCYTTDGSAPIAGDVVTGGATICAHGTSYTGAFTVSAPAAVKVIGVRAGYAPSAVASATYAFKAAAPTFSPNGGLVASGTSVSVSSVTPSSTIHCSHDGSTPNAGDGGTTSFTITGTESPRCVATASGYATSDESTASFALAYSTPAPANLAWLWWNEGNATWNTVISPTKLVVPGASEFSLSGTSASGATVKVYDAGTNALVSTVTASGTAWTAPSLPGTDSEGTHSYYATATEGGGSESVHSATATLVVDRAAPSVPVIASPADGATVGAGTVVISGTAEAGAIINVYVAPGSDAIVFADGSGNWSRNVTVSAGIYMFSARATDAAGNYSTTSANRLLYVVAGQAATPTFSPAAGAVTIGTVVTPSNTTAGSTVRCTLDGSTPTAATPPTTTFTVSAALTAKCLATASGYTDSTVATAAYTIALAATPAFSPVAGAVASGTVVTPSSATAGSSIYCTHDGSTPTGASALTTTFTVTGAETAKCIAQKALYADSAVGSAAYTIAVPAATPTFSPVAGAVVNGTSVTISTAAAGCGPYIYWNTTGSPTTGSTHSISATLSTPATIYAKVIGCPGYEDSAVGSAAYTLTEFANDAFSDPDGTLLTAHTPNSGFAWVAHPFSTNPVKISSARIYGEHDAGGTLGMLYKNDAPAGAEYDVEADLRVVSAADWDAGIWGRLSTTTLDGYYARYSKYAGVPLASWQIYKFTVAGGAVLLGSYPQALSVGATYHMKFQVRNAAKKLFIDGVERISTTDNVITAAGRAGVSFNATEPAGVASAIGMHLDNFKATNP